MDKIIKRTSYIKTYRARQKLREAAGRRKLRRTLLINQQKQYAAERKQQIDAYRTARREDWFLGPLAPRRDAGEAAKTYGTLSARLIQGIKNIEKAKNWGIRNGDRVVVTDVRHRDRGKIGVVRAVRKTTEDVIVERMNLGDVVVPPNVLVQDPDKTPTRTIEFPLPLSSVRLVYPLRDPTTGQTRDTIIESITVHNGYRSITGYEDTKLETPVGEKEENRETHPSDTPIKAAEDVTYVPTLIRPPIPSGVIDELRNKYSKYRDRHEPSYVEYHNRKAAKEERRQARKRGAMMSPMEEWRARKEEEMREKEAVEPSAGLLEGIGRIMAENRGRWMERGGEGRDIRA